MIWIVIAFLLISSYIQIYGIGPTCPECESRRTLKQNEGYICFDCQRTFKNDL